MGPVLPSRWSLGGLLLPALLGLPGGGGGAAKEVVVVTLKAVDRFHSLVLDLFADGGSLEEAERVVRLRLEREARRHGPESAEVGQCWGSLGLVFKDSGEYDRALECMRKDLAIGEKRVGPEDASLAGTYNLAANMSVMGFRCYRRPLFFATILHYFL